MIRVPRIVPVLLLACLVGAAAAGAAAAQRVVVSIPPQKFLAERIGGERVDVQVMLAPGQAPETYEPTPSRMAELAGARFYFAIGVPFERAWLPEIGRQNPSLHVVECCAQFAAAGDDGHDPHVWVDPLRFLRAARLMHDALAGRDAANRLIYDRRYRRLSEELTMLHRDLRYLLRHRRIDEFIISHGALGPLADAYGLKQIALEDGGREAGPRTLAGIVELAKSLGIRTVFVQKQHGSASARALARELGAALVEIDPLAENYLDNMRAIGHLLAAATR